MVAIYVAKLQKACMFVSMRKWYRSKEFLPIPSPAVLLITNAYERKPVLKKSNSIWNFHFLQIVTYISLGISKKFLSKNWFSFFNSHQSMKQASLVTLVIPNYHIITQTSGFVYLAYQLWDHMPLLIHGGTEHLSNY